MRTEIILKKDLPGCKAGAKGFQKISPELWQFQPNHIFHIDTIRQNPDWFEIKTIYEEEDVKEGTYWKDNGECVRRIDKIKSGFIHYTNITYNSKHSDIKFITNEKHNDRPATDKEVESALIKEAERRYGKNINLDNGNIYYPDLDVLIYEGREVYNSGKWAEIIEEKKEPSKEEVANEKKTDSLDLIKSLACDLKSCNDSIMNEFQKTSSYCQKIINEIKKLEGLNGTE